MRACLLTMPGINYRVPFLKRQKNGLFHSCRFISDWISRKMTLHSRIFFRAGNVTVKIVGSGNFTNQGKQENHACTGTVFHRYVCDIIVILQISIYRYIATNELDDRVRLHTGYRIIPQHLSSTVVVIDTIIGNSFSWYCLLYRLSTENKTIKNIIKK